MVSLRWLSALLLVQGARSYILLTANLDDVHAIAKQISESPVAGQINSILRRASTLFNLQVRSNSDAGNQARFPRTNSQDSDSSIESIKGNGIERRTKAPHHLRRNHNQRSQGHLQSARRSETIPPANQESTQVREHAEILPTAESPKYNKVSSSQSKEVSRLDSQAQREVDEEHKKRNQVDGASSGQGQEEVPRQRGDHSNDARREVTEKRSHTDEVVALGKNASFYLSTIKKIIENV